MCREWLLPASHHLPVVSKDVNKDLEHCWCVCQIRIILWHCGECKRFKKSLKSVAGMCHQWHKMTCQIFWMEKGCRGFPAHPSWCNKLHNFVMTWVFCDGQHKLAHAKLTQNPHHDLAHLMEINCLPNCQGHPQQCWQNQQQSCEQFYFCCAVSIQMDKNMVHVSKLHSKLFSQQVVNASGGSWVEGLLPAEQVLCSFFECTFTSRLSSVLASPVALVSPTTQADTLLCTAHCCCCVDCSGSNSMHPHNAKQRTAEWMIVLFHFFCTKDRATRRVSQSSQKCDTLQQ